MADFIGESNIIDGVMHEDRVVGMYGRKFRCLDGGFAPPTSRLMSWSGPRTSTLSPCEQGQLTGTVTEVTFKGVHYDTIVDFRGFKWLIQTTDFSPCGAKIGVKIDPDGFHIMKKSAYSGRFGDYSSYSSEYDELNEDRTRRRTRMRNMRNKAGHPLRGMDGYFCGGPPGAGGGVRLHTKDGGLHPDNFSNMGHVFAPRLRHSFVLAVTATVICILIGYPWPIFFPRRGAGAQGGHDAHHAAHVDEFPAADLLLDIPAGRQRAVFNGIGLFDPSTPSSACLQSDIMINTPGAVVLGMVYNFLPFMVMPIFSVIEKIDPRSLRRPRTWAPTPPRSSAR